MKSSHDGYCPYCYIVDDRDIRFFAIWFDNLLNAVISLCVMSLLISLEFYILQAPDVAIAEAGIGAGLTTAIYIMASKLVGHLVGPERGTIK